MYKINTNTIVDHSNNSFDIDTPNILYVYDDLHDFMRKHPHNSRVRSELLSDLYHIFHNQPHIKLLDYSQLIQQLISQIEADPFEETIAVSHAGKIIANRMHSMKNILPNVREWTLSRQELQDGSYQVLELSDCSNQPIMSLEGCNSLAIVDDTIYSGLTMNYILGHLPKFLTSKTHLFCLVGYESAVTQLREKCDVTCATTISKSNEHKMSVIRASSLIVDSAIRRKGKVSLAFYQRPEWIKAWFPNHACEVSFLCKKLNELLNDGVTSANQQFEYED